MIFLISFCEFPLRFQSSPPPLPTQWQTGQALLVTPFSSKFFCRRIFSGALRDFLPSSIAVPKASLHPSPPQIMAPPLLLPFYPGPVDFEILFLVWRVGPPLQIGKLGKPIFSLLFGLKRFFSRYPPFSPRFFFVSTDQTADSSLVLIISFCKTMPLRLLILTRSRFFFKRAPPLSVS